MLFCLSYMHVCPLPAWCLKRSEDVRSPGTRVTKFWAAPGVCFELNPGPQQEQQMSHLSSPKDLIHFNDWILHHCVCLCVFIVFSLSASPVMDAQTDSAAVRNIATKIRMHTSLWHANLISVCPAAGLSEPILALALTFWANSVLLSIMAPLIHTPSDSNLEFCLLHVQK